MPASITHLLVQHRLKNDLNFNLPHIHIPGLNLPHHLHLGLNPPFKELLNGNETNPYNNFGSIGPDFLFFTLKEYKWLDGGKLGGRDEFLNLIFRFYDALEPFIEFKNEVTKDITEHIIDPIEAAILPLVPQDIIDVFAQLKNTSALLSSALMNSIAKVVVDEVDFFYLFYPKVQQGCPETDWFWFDFLHYRKTGTFCSNMWKIANSQNNDNLKRYCLGYASHIGTDVVGHSYVNAVVGGPYRNHWRRHKLVENWIDAYAKNHYPDIPEIVELLKAEIEGEDYKPESISGSNYYRLTDFKDEHDLTRLPKDLGDMIIRALEMTYPDPNNRPPMLDFNNLEEAYLGWQKWFKRTTTIGKAHRPDPVLPPGSAASSLINNYISGFPALPGGGSGGLGGGFNIHNIVHNLASFTNYLVNVLDYTFTWIENNAAAILALTGTTLLETIKWLLYQLQKAIYEIAENTRFIMVLCGYIYPEADDLNHPQFGKAFITTDFVGNTQGGSFDYTKYPYKQVVPSVNCVPKIGDLMPNARLTGNEYQLMYPNVNAALETPYTEPTPKPFTAHCFPETFIDGVLFPDNNVFNNLSDANTPYLPLINPPKAPTHEVDIASENNSQLGSALTFSQKLINEKIADLPNFNLDSDRGYGWKDWELTNNQGASTLNDNDPINTKYTN